MADAAQILFKLNDQLPDELGQMRSAVETLRTWARDFLTTPNEELGREGPVCPFTAPSLDRRLFWCTVNPATDREVDALYVELNQYASDFRKLEPIEPPEALFKTLVIVFPHITSFDQLDTLQARLKPEFVKEGLMIGQFYPGCEVPGLWNPEFRPLSAPLPLLAIRNMVVTDFPFVATRSDWVDAYLRRFAPSLPTQVRRSIIRRIDSA